MYIYIYVYLSYIMVYYSISNIYIYIVNYGILYYSILYFFMRFVDGLEFGAVRESLGPDPPIHILTLLDFHSYFVGYLRRCTLLGRSCSLQVIFDQFRLGFSNWIPNLKFRVVGLGFTDASFI